MATKRSKKVYSNYLSVRLAEHGSMGAQRTPRGRVHQERLATWGVGDQREGPRVVGGACEREADVGDESDRRVSDARACCKRGRQRQEQS